MSTSPSVPTDPTSAVPAELRQRLRELRKRYGRQSFTAQRDRLDTAANRRRFQLAEVRKQIAELEQRARVIEAELEGLGKGAAALVGEEIARYEKAFPEGWSPTQVPGYRIWTIERNRMVGARFVWETPVYEATCDEFPDFEEDVPHTDDRCGRLGCGVYATKRLSDLIDLHIDESSRLYAAARVGMDGKVVEHEDGYRAARAEVISLAVIGRSREIFTDDPNEIAAAYDDPTGALFSHWGRPLQTPVLSRIAEHLQEGKEQQWILESGSE